MKKSYVENKTARRQIGYISPWSIIQLDNRNPIIIAFWSLMYAGLGHFLLDRYIRGIILFLGEIFLNYMSHLNIAIYYTMTGRFYLSKQVLDTKWVVLYVVIYGFAIYDSYRETIVINNTFRLADREKIEFKCLEFNSNTFCILNSVSPYVAVFWSVIIPGSGSFMLQRMNRAVFLMTFWVINSYFSGLYSGIIKTFTGQFDQIQSSIDIQWILNVPSIWAFSAFESYSCAIENNKLFRKELTEYLKSNFQSATFPISAIMKGE